MAITAGETYFLSEDGLRAFVRCLKQALDRKIDKVPGKDTSMNNYTPQDAEKLAGIQAELGTTDSPEFQDMTINGYIDGATFT